MTNYVVTKQCGKCKRVLPTTAFWAATGRKAGLQSSCKECLRRYYFANRVERSAYLKKYEARKDPQAEKFRKRAATRRLRATKAGRMRHSAREAVRNAVRTGRLVRQPCEVCGDPKAQAHHHLGYEREHRLHVRWLCHAHHVEAHLISAAE